MVGPSRLRYISHGLTVAATLAITPAFGADPNNGERLAHRWCEACHVVVVSSTQRRSTTDQTPPSRVLQRHRASMPQTSRRSFSIRIRRCRIWTYLARKRRILPHILQRSNSPADAPQSSPPTMPHQPKRLPPYNNWPYFREQAGTTQAVFGFSRHCYFFCDFT